jgi:TonB family protein
MQESLISHPYFSSLALTLIHFMWQGCLIALALKLALILTSQKNPQLRYTYASLAMLSCLILPFITFALIFQRASITLADSIHRLPLSDFAVPGIQNNSFYWSKYIIELLPYLSVSWLTIVMLLTIKLLVEVFMVNQLPRQSLIPTDDKLAARFIQLVEKMQLSTTPSLLISLKTEVPMTIGWLKPVILLPASMLSGLTTSQLEMLILHELAHIRRLDYLVNFVQTLVALLLFFHPAVQWISKQMRNEREYCSDDIAVQYCGDAIAYAHTLADTAAICSKHRHHTIPNMAMAASGGDLKQRVVRLVDHHCTPSNDLGKWMAATALILSLLTFSTQQLFTLGIFDIGVNHQKIIPAFMSSINSKQSSMTKMTVASQVLTSRASYPHPLIPVKRPTINQSLLVTATWVNNIDLENQAPALKLDMSKQLTASAHNILNTLSTINSSITQEQIETHRREKKSIAMVTHSNNVMALITEYSETKILIENAATEQLPISTFSFRNTHLSRYLSAPNNDYSAPLTQLNNPTVANVDILDKNTLESQLSLIDEFQPNSSMDEQFSPTNSMMNLSLLAQKTQKTGIDESNIDLSPLQEKAKIISAIDPEYPSSAKRKGLELEVHVHFTIDESGQIKNIEFEQQNKIGYFRNAIKTAMRKWAFHPAKIDGQPVESKMTKIFSFIIS